MFRDFAEQMKEYRRVEGITQANIAARIGVTPGRVGQMENGEVAISDAVYNAAFACSVDLYEAFMAGWLKQEGQENEVSLWQRSSPLALAAMRRAGKRVRMVAISGKTRVLQGWPSLQRVLDNDGTVEIGLLEPGSDAFRQRAAEESYANHERLRPGTMTRRLEFEVWSTIEALKGLQSYASDVERGRLVVVTYDWYPDVSVTIVDSFLCEFYRYRPKHRGPKDPVRVFLDPDLEGFKEAEKIVDSVLERGKLVSLEDLASDKAEPLKPVYLAQG